MHYAFLAPWDGEHNVEQQSILSLNHVTRTFGGINALSDLSIAIDRGKITGIIGPNGAGKTTTFNIITGAYTPSSGTVEFRGNTISGKPTFEIAQGGIARTFQNIRLFKSMTVWEHLLVAQGRKRFDFHKFCSVGSRSGPSVRQAEAALEAFGLTDHRDKRAGSLPYGIQRKVEMARALTQDPHLLLLDEPIAGMSHEEASELSDLLKKLSTDGLSILLIEHDMGFVMGLCDQLFVLDFGKLIATGSPEQVRTNPAVLDAYLGGED